MPPATRPTVAHSHDDNNNLTPRNRGRSIAGVGEHHLGRLREPHPRELVTGRRDHRPEVTEVGRVDVDLGGNHDLVPFVTTWAL